ncbi:hypothetical protein L0244_32900 [bacterium]|nr:hypothetical protein [bacterium]
MIFPKAASYKLLTNISAEGKSIEQIPTEIFLPSKTTGRIKVVFYPDDKQKKALDDCWRISFAGTMKESNSDKGIRISGEATIRQIYTKPWPDDLTDRWIKVRISRFEINEPLETPIRSATFYLTYSSFLQPWKGFEYKLSGETKIYTNKKSKFSLGNRVKIEFDTHFKRIERKSGNSLSFPELVGNYHNFKENFSPAKILNNLDDLLLLVSFAERYRCVCVGWQYFDQSSFTTFYRRDIAIPKTTEAHRAEAFTLIRKYHFKEFIKKAYGKFNRSKKKNLLRQAIQKVVPRQKTIETYYMSLFSGIETIMEIVVGPDLILKRKKFDDLRELIEDLIASDRAATQNQRKFIKEKISELNRISFASRFSQLIKKLNYQDDDLWPMTDSADGPSLQKIRHQLIHGRFLAPNVEYSVYVALYHLQWTLERLLLKLLGWNYADSTASRNYLSAYLEPYKSWKIHREVLRSDLL